MKIGGSCNLIGKNEQTTIKNYADWSTSWLKNISYDLILTIQKLKTICNGEHSSESDSVEYNALCELIGSLYKQLKEKYSDDEIDTSKYDKKYSVLKQIYNSTVGLKDELTGKKPIKIETTRLFNSDKKEYHKIVIPGNTSYYGLHENNFTFVHWFYEIDSYIHEYFGDVENPFETEFSLVFNDIDVVKRLNSCVLKNVIYSPKHKELKHPFDFELHDDNNSIKVVCQVSVLENLKFNYPKIKFEYNENVTKEFVLTEEDCYNNKTKQLLD